MSLGCSVEITLHTLVLLPHAERCPFELGINVVINWLRRKKKKRREWTKLQPHHSSTEQTKRIIETKHTSQNFNTLMLHADHVFHHTLPAPPPPPPQTKACEPRARGENLRPVEMASSWNRICNSEPGFLFGCRNGGTGRKGRTFGGERTPPAAWHRLKC